jgi:hypothetical protein
MAPRWTASPWTVARTFLDFQPSSANIVTYAHDPRDDPGLLSNPAAVAVNGIRVR